MIVLALLLVALVCGLPHGLEKPRFQHHDDDGPADQVLLPPDYGFTTDITWYNNVEEAKEKPLLVIIHTSWCGICKRMKHESLSGWLGLKKLSRKFVMVNILDDEEKSPEYLMPDERFQILPPDGDYFPRVLFVDPFTGEVNKKAISQMASSGHKNLDYFFGGGGNGFEREILPAMRVALDTFRLAHPKKGAPGPRQEEL